MELQSLNVAFSPIRLTCRNILFSVWVLNGFRRDTFEIKQRDLPLLFSNGLFNSTLAILSATEVLLLHIYNSN